jgi:hypothetical protein
VGRPWEEEGRNLLLVEGRAQQQEGVVKEKELQPVEVRPRLLLVVVGLEGDCWGQKVAWEAAGSTHHTPRQDFRMIQSSHPCRRS